MAMKFKLKSKKTLIALAAASAVLLSLAAWAAMQVPNQGIVQTVPRENVPTVAYDQGSSEIIIPFVQDGELFLSRVKKPTAGATTTVEISRQSVAKDVEGKVDVNRLTGEYLYQTLSASSNDLSSITTWLGDTKGRVTEIYHGAIASKLSPGGSFIALTDYTGILRIINRQGKEVASFGQAGYPVFSPDGTKLAFFKAILGATDDIGGLTVVDLASGKELATYHSPGKGYTPFVFSEDVSTLFFSADSASASQDPSNPNRVDIYALSISNGAVRLVTTGVSKLPYIEYASVRYVSSQRLLVLYVENTIWNVDTQTGSVKTFHNVADLLQTDSGNTFLFRPKDRNVTDKTWNTFIAE